jgi:hypothetical protein
MSDERRKFIRFNVPLKAEVNLETRVDVLKEGLTWDFSREGLRLILKDVDIVNGTRVQLKIFVPSKNKPVAAKARVVWTKSGSAQWEIGMVLEDITPQDKTVVLDHVYEEWKKKKIERKIP